MAPPPQPRYFTLFDCLPRLATLVGAVCGASGCGLAFGPWGALGGAFAGAAVGFAAYVLSVLFVVAGLALGVSIRYGRRAAKDFLRGRGDSSPDDAGTHSG